MAAAQPSIAHYELQIADFPTRPERGGRDGRAVPHRGVESPKSKVESPSRPQKRQCASDGRATCDIVWSPMRRVSHGTREPDNVTGGNLGERGGEMGASKSGYRSERSGTLRRARVLSELPVSC